MAQETSTPTNSASDPAMGVLAGLKIVDCTRVLGGPFCTQWLGDHGADVVKVEPPRGDETRGWGPPFLADDASYFLGVNRSKRGIALDLSGTEGQAVLRRMLADADVLIENFKPGTLEKWGMGHATLKEEFPRLIHARISGFGADGPFGGLPGYDAIIQAQAGLMSINGERERSPLRLGTPIVDIATGISAAFGIMAALYERQRSGQGQFVETSLYDVACSLLHPHAANYFLNGKTPMRNGNPHPNIVPYDMFRCGDDQVFVGTGNDRQFRKLCTVLGDPALADDPRFTTNADRYAHTHELRERLEARLADKNAETICQELMAVGVPAGPVNDIPTVVDHPHTLARDMRIDIDDYRGLGNPVKFSRTPAQMTRKPPRFGQDTRAVLAELGYSEQEIQAMIDAGAAVAGTPS
ncbi:MAG: CaiB/BaiF CoA-transferase family protein [Pseudomonadota bacterium]